MQHILSWYMRWLRSLQQNQAGDIHSCDICHFALDMINALCSNNNDHNASSSQSWPLEISTKCAFGNYIRAADQVKHQFVNAIEAKVRRHTVSLGMAGGFLPPVLCLSLLGSTVTMLWRALTSLNQSRQFEMSVHSLVVGCNFKGTGCTLSYETKYTPCPKWANIPPPTRPWTICRQYQRRLI